MPIQYLFGIDCKRTNIPLRAYTERVALHTLADMTNKEIRRANLQSLRDETGGNSQLAARLGRAYSLVFNWLSGAKNIGDGAARHIEESCGKKVGWLDTDRGQRADKPVLLNHDNDGLGELSQEETDLVLAWRAWSEERRNVIRLVMRDTALQGHPCLEVARNGNAADQERANEILRKAQEKARAEDKKRRTVLRRKTEARRDGKK